MTTLIDSDQSFRMVSTESICEFSYIYFSFPNRVIGSQKLIYVFYSDLYFSCYTSKFIRIVFALDECSKWMRHFDIEMVEQDGNWVIGHHD